MPFRFALGHLLHRSAPESALVPDQVVDAASFVGDQAVGLSVEGLKNAAADAAKPDPPDSSSWYWDHDPFRPGIQLTHDPLTADVTGMLGADHLEGLDLFDDGIDTALG